MSSYSKVMSNDEFTQAKQTAIANQPAAAPYKLSSLSLTDESITQEHVMIDGKAVSVNPGFFRGLAKILNVNEKLINSIKGRGDDGGMGQKFLNQFMEALKTFQASKNNQDVMLIGDPTTHALTNIISGDYPRVSNEKLFQLAEQLLNDYSYLQLRNIEQRGPDVEIQLLSDRDMGFQHLDGIGNDEVFQFGFTLNNQGAHTALGDFAYRLVCSNGMMGMRSNMNFVLAGTSQDNMYRFFNHIQEASKRGFIPEEFETNLQIANKIPASLAEVEDAYQLAAAKINESDDNIKETYDLQLRKNHLWGMDKTKGRLIGKNIDPTKLKSREKQCINSGMKVWDLVNALTFLGSGNSTIPFTDQARMVKQGGKLFASEYDLMYSQLYKL